MTQAAILAIDTSGPRLQLAVRQDGKEFIHIEEIAKGHAEILFDRIGSLLGEAGLIYPDLAAIAVTTGPGSFTGLRIGLSAARGLGLTLKIPVIGIPTLLAAALPEIGSQPVAVIADARRGEVYFELFDSQGKSDVGPMALSADEAEIRIPPATRRIDHMVPNIAAMARFATQIDPAEWPPEPHYVRSADAKPQDGARLARTGAAL